ncbi:cytochrome P450 [Lentinula edodes]|nr:cytochrome P450 [Lentinula edodes]
MALSALTPEEMSIGIFVTLILTSILFLWYYHHSYQSGIKLPLPPGPRKLPLLGNTLDMPATDQHIIFSQWAEQYGSDILHLKVAGGDYIILNSYEAVIDLLDKRSAIYSSRPHFTMLQDLVGWKGDLLFMSSGKVLNAHRKLFHQGRFKFHPTNSAIHRIHEKRALGIFLNSLIDTPEEWVSHIKQMIGAIIIGVAYGVQVQPKDDPNITAASKMYSVLNAASVPGAFLVDILSFLKYVPAWFPGASFKQKAKAWYGIRNATIRPPFMQVKQALIDGTANDSFTSRCLANAEHFNPDSDSDCLSEEEEMIMQTAGTLYEGGADTGKTALQTFLLAMMCFPDAQHAAQEELDHVIGQKRLPDYQDLDDPATLPYVRAIILECLRWQTVVPLGKYTTQSQSVPHLIDTEDTYKGYYIPRGSIILPNVWGILRDKRKYGPTASTFDPKRWLLQTFDDKGKVQRELDSDMMEHDPIPISFGFGRRVCPGQHMALSTFQINVASLLHCFNINPPVDENGNHVIPEIKYVSGITNGPTPFDCCIKPRSNEHAALVQHMLMDE